MSTNLFGKGRLLITSFYGGQERGHMIQVTHGVRFVQLTPAEAKVLAEELARMFDLLPRKRSKKKGGAA